MVRKAVVYVLILLFKLLFLLKVEIEFALVNII